MSTQELILEMLTNLDKKVDLLDRKIDDKFQKLPCEKRGIMIDRLEQKEIERKEYKKLLWSAIIAAFGSFGIGIWNWLKSQP